MAELLCIVGGLISGVAAGMGMGGGTVLIPILTLLVSIDQHAAQGINMISFLPAALAAIFIHRKEGRIDFKDCIPIIIAGIIGAVGLYRAKRTGITAAKLRNGAVSNTAPLS